MKIDTVIYKILEYLYKSSDEAMPSMEPIMPEALKISPILWNNAVAILYENGFVKNIEVEYHKTGYIVLNGNEIIDTIKGYVILNEDEMKITLKGIEYYKNNPLQGYNI